MLRTPFSRTLLAGAGFGAALALVLPAQASALDISPLRAAEQIGRELGASGLERVSRMFGTRVGFHLERALGSLGFEARLHRHQGPGDSRPARAPAAPAAPQQGGPPPAPPKALSASTPAERPTGQEARVVSTQVNISRDEAALQLGFADGREVEFAVREGRMFADGRDLGAVPQHGPAERAWRALLNRAVDVPASQLPTVIRDWAAPAPDGALKNAMLAALSGAGASTTAPLSQASADSLAKLQRSLDSMRQKLEEAEHNRMEARAAEHAREAEEARGWGGPFRYIWRGLSGLMGTLVLYAILLALGIATVFFGARPHLEAVADTARRQMGRSFVVGLAGSFLVIPVYILGAVALAISIVGIPVLLVWVPLYPLAVILAALLGYLGSAHATGEALAERRFYGGDWFRRGNSYYFLMTGLGLLLGLFAAGHVVEMAGRWLAFIHGLLVFMGVVTTWFAFTVGLGAVLLTRGGTRPTTGLGSVAEPDLSRFEEETRA